MSVRVELKECSKCHRVGFRWFVPFGDYGWVCVGEKACRARRAKREKAS